jgi:hypothetical protein
MIEFSMTICLAILAAIQIVLTYLVIGALVRDQADREDVFLLIPLFWIIPFVKIMAEKIPEALKRPTRN